MRIGIAALLVLLFVPTVSIAGSEPDQRQHGAHVHGQATGTLALDDDRLSLSLVIPGINLAGFEHAPRDENQRERLVHTVAHLESGRWMTVDPDGACRVESLTVARPGFGEDGAAQVNDSQHQHSHHDHDNDHHHDHGHQHDHDHDHEQAHHHEHAEFHIEASLHCQHPERLSWLDLDLFAEYEGNELMRIDVLTDQVVDRARLRPGNFRIHLDE